VVKKKAVYEYSREKKKANVSTSIIGGNASGKRRRERGTK